MLSPMKKFFPVISLLMLVSLGSSAQQKITDTLQQRTRVADGTVSIHQDERLYRLLGSIYYPGSNRQLQVKGYRLQVYAGNNTRASRDEALSAAATLRSRFPDMPIYTEFVSPRWVCRAGDYRTMEEAHQAMTEIKKLGLFREMTILPNQSINISF